MKYDDLDFAKGDWATVNFCSEFGHSPHNLTLHFLDDFYACF
jgi:hypothetical protein